MTDREKLIELLGADVCKHSNCEDCESSGSTDACIATLKAHMADHLIANGVTIPVRCKDCKHWEHSDNGWGDCINPRFHLPGHANPTMHHYEYCALGERRTE